MSLRGSYQKQKRSIKKRLKNYTKFIKKYHRAVILAAGLLILAFLGYLGNGFFGHTTNDSAVEHDLVNIENTVLNYAQKHGELPLSLTDLHISHLNGKIKDYHYTADHPKYEGGPNISYEVCAKFKNKGAAFSTGSTSGIDAYSQHRKGTQCFNNGIYKSESHVYAILNEEEKPKPKPVHVEPVDTEKLKSLARDIYRPQIQLLGAAYAEIDLFPNCVDLNQVSDAPSKKTYSCRVTITKNVSATANEVQGKQLMTRLVALTDSQGFKYPFTDEGSGYMSIGPKSKDCYLRANYYPNWDPPIIKYELSCQAPDTAEVPPGFLLLKN
jgi:hypothetical protein